MRKSCEDCKWYAFFDSAYGRCKRFPPQEHLQWDWLGRKTYRTRYIFVAFDTDTCGEYGDKEKP